jgi:hypothetical protein
MKDVKPVERFVSLSINGSGVDRWLNRSSIQILIDYRVTKFSYIYLVPFFFKMSNIHWVVFTRFMVRVIGLLHKMPS